MRAKLPGHGRAPQGNAPHRARWAAVGRIGACVDRLGVAERGNQLRASYGSFNQARIVGIAAPGDDEETCQCIPEELNPKAVPFTAGISDKFTSGSDTYTAKGTVKRTVTTHRAHCEPKEY